MIKMKSKSRTEFYRNGPDNQKSPDIVIDLVRPSFNDIEEWTPEQKKNALKILQIGKTTFDKFINSLEQNLEK
jgi:hypothetical protein